MVSECWCVVSGLVEVGLKSVAPISIEVMCLLNLVGDRDESCVHFSLILGVLYS